MSIHMSISMPTHRPIYLTRTIQSLLELPEARKYKIYISQDGDMSTEVANVARRYELEIGSTHLQVTANGSKLTVTWHTSK